MKNISTEISETKHPPAPPPVEFYFWQPFHSNDPIPVNFGDDLFGKIVGELIGRKVLPCAPNYSGRKIFIGGSTLGYARNGDQVWGAGIRDGQFDSKIQHLKVHAVRGPQTAAILRNRGITVPFCYGDPAILWPDVFPHLGKPCPKWDLGIIPHFRELMNAPNFSFPSNARVINPAQDALAVLDEIRQCKAIVASSLHGLICAEAAGIPAEPYKLDSPYSEPDFKYADYYAASGREWKPHSSIADAMAAKFEPPPDCSVEKKFLIQAFQNILQS
jgi:pyruvyltransferase